MSPFVLFPACSYVIPQGVSFRFHPPGNASVPGTGKRHPSCPGAVCKQFSAEPTLLVFVSRQLALSPGHTIAGWPCAKVTLAPSSTVRGRWQHFATTLWVAGFNVSILLRGIMGKRLLTARKVTASLYYTMKILHPDHGRPLEFCFVDLINMMSKCLWGSMFVRFSDNGC